MEKMISYIFIFFILIFGCFSCGSISKDKYNQVTRENEKLKKEIALISSKTTSTSLSPTNKETFNSPKNKVQIENYLNKIYSELEEIRKYPKNTNATPEKIKESHQVIDDLVKRENDSMSVENHLYKLMELTNNVGGSFGLLDETKNAQLLIKLRRLSTLKSEARNYLKEKCLDIYIRNKIYESQPMILFSERHGGPLHYDLRVIRLSFENNNKVKIETDHFRLDKKDTFYGTYKMTGAFPHIVFGDVFLDDGRKFKFQTVRGAMNYIFLEDPPFWSKSLIVKVNN